MAADNTILPNLANMFAIESLILVGVFTFMADPKIMAHIERFTGLHGMSVSLATGFVFVFVSLVMIKALAHSNTNNKVKFLGTKIDERQQWTSSSTPATPLFI
jgi:hypothetical protein